MVADVHPTGLRNTALAASRFGEFGQRWLDAMWVGDPLADAVVAEFAQLPHHNGMQMLHRAIADGIDNVDEAPASLRALFTQLDEGPPWVDPDRCDRAAANISRQTRSFGFALGAASLLAGAHNTIAGKPLTFTGRYAEQPGVRSIEVGSWLSAITTPGGLDRHQLGFERTVRVRMIHAHVRARLSHDDRWDHDAWGVPIPQAYMAFTLTEFGRVALDAMHKLGVRYTDRELDDIFHLWRAVGRLVGMDDVNNPKGVDDQARIQALFELTSPGPDDGDRAFVAALAGFQATELGSLLPRWFPLDSADVVHAFERAFVGDRIADDLRVPTSRLRLLARAVGPVLAGSYWLHDTVVPDGKARRTRRGFDRRATELQRLRDRYSVRHQLVDDAPTT